MRIFSAMAVLSLIGCRSFPSAGSGRGGRASPRLREVGQHAFDDPPRPVPSLRPADVHLGGRQGTQEPRPDRSLVVGAVPGPRASLVSGTVPGIRLVEAPEANRGIEPLLDDREYPQGLLPREEGERKAYGEDLVRPKGAVPVFSVDDVV